MAHRRSIAEDTLYGITDMMGSWEKMMSMGDEKERLRWFLREYAEELARARFHDHANMSHYAIEEKDMDVRWELIVALARSAYLREEEILKKTIDKMMEFYELSRYMVPSVIHYWMQPLSMDDCYSPFDEYDKRKQLRYRRKDLFGGR